MRTILFMLLGCLRMAAADALVVWDAPAEPGRLAHTIVALGTNGTATVKTNLVPAGQNSFLWTNAPAGPMFFRAWFRGTNGSVSDPSADAQWFIFPPPRVLITNAVQWAPSPSGPWEGPVISVTAVAPEGYKFFRSALLISRQ